VQVMRIAEPSTLNDYFKQGDEFFINRAEETTLQQGIYHAHEFVELTYVAQGSGYHMIGDKEYRVSKGDFFIIKRNIGHLFYKDVTSELVNYNLMFKPAFFDSMLTDFNDFNSLAFSYLFRNLCQDIIIQEDLCLNVHEQIEFEYLINQIYSEYQTKQQGYLSMIRGYMILLVTKLFRYAQKYANVHQGDFKDSNIIQHLKMYLQDSYAQTINLNELAQKSFYSKNYLCTIFKETTGMTILQYIQNIRIKEACKLIEDSDKPIKDVMSEVGFPDHKAFNKSFKKIMGVSPKAYRDRYNDNSN